MSNKDILRRQKEIEAEQGMSLEDALKIEADGTASEEDRRAALAVIYLPYMSA